MKCLYILSSILFWLFFFCGTEHCASLKNHSLPGERESEYVSSGFDVDVLLLREPEHIGDTL